ncbi:hypothetical protein ACFFJY_06870 [Fictibacillus aquaticus]|uniref:Uncharacterized protein n=1 Tax=Fictibacillus aquaticus TaxID=2021314 RepID=A0A235FA77_9BACL|nr:hypothetical protein [Fictibacillus aquaticus]OYD58079.1 hypothetical protein CGZ90_09340 [Fictibacillus aquaticus]
MRRRFTARFRSPRWFQSLKAAVGQLTIPLFIFQLIRTILFPTSVDFFLLFVLLIFHIIFSYEVL